MLNDPQSSSNDHTDIICHGHIVPTSPDDINANWICEICRNEISPDKVIEIENGLANLLKDSVHSSFENVEKVVGELSNHLHSNHYLQILAKRHLIGMYGLDLSHETTEKLQIRETLCKEVRNITAYIFCYTYNGPTLPFLVYKCVLLPHYTFQISFLLFFRFLRC